MWDCADDLDWWSTALRANRTLMRLVRRVSNTGLRVMIATKAAGHRAGSESGKTLIRGLGTVSIALGLAEISASGRITRELGQRDGGGLVRLYGWREIGSGLLCLALGPTGVASRLAATRSTSQRSRPASTSAIPSALMSAWHWRWPQASASST